MPLPSDNHFFPKMKRTSILAIIGLCLTSSTSADVQGFDAWAARTGSTMEFRARVQGTPGELFAILSGPTQGAPLNFRTASLVGAGRFDGNGRALFSQTILNANQMPSHFGVQLYAATRGAAGLQLRTVWVPLMGQGGTLCQDFEPDYTLGDSEPVAGETLTNQWAAVNMAISAVNNVAAHPQKAIVFDSANPTGGDTDLATPGYGPGNNLALGNLIIIAENDVDLDHDGLVDDPDDEHDGGILRFDFSEPYRMCSATIVDIDDGIRSELRFYIGAAMTLEVIPLDDLGDNSVQTVTFDKHDVRRFELVLGGSGALAHLGMVPCPMILDFDESPFGRPLGLQAGEWITNQFAFMGVDIATMNNVGGHPDKAILFDSEHPTGGDTDLITPGYGLNNSEALGNVLVIAENDVDANGDGLVDDPDDEAGGGQIQFVFAEPVTFFATTVLDVDALERDVFTFFDAANNPLSILEILALGDNSVQVLTSPVSLSGVSRIQINLTGSGAHTRLRWCPDSNVSGN